MATEKTTQILEEIKALTILEMKDLVAALEEEFGVSAAPVAVAGAAAPAAAAAEAEKSEYDVVMTSFGDKKLDVIKVVREITGMGLKDAKDLVEGVPSKIKEAVGKADGEAIVKQLTEAGATAELKITSKTKIYDVCYYSENQFKAVKLEKGDRITAYADADGNIIYEMNGGTGDLNAFCKSGLVYLQTIEALAAE